MMYERSIKLIIEGKIDNIALLGSAIRAICSTVVNDEVLLFNLELCLIEAVTNVINHAYHRQPGNNVEVIVSVDDLHVNFKVIDTGDHVPPPPPKRELNYNPSDMTTWPESGMGLFLIHSIMDEVSYSEHEGKNILMMRKKIN
jgi:serine/threonine-protein kinase RsbW